MDELIKILEKFDKARSKVIKKNKFNGKTIEEKYKVIADCFEPCAKDILCNGYFEITCTWRENGQDIQKKRIIDIGCIELYYHEEEGDIKDPIMYHTNDRGSYSQFCNGKTSNEKTRFPYYEFGSFNLHTSGVDVTFENPDEKYRASFLIRAYRVIDNETELNGKKYDGRSSYIFDDLFPQGVLLGESKKFKIEWKNCTIKSEGVEVERCKRRNIPEYKKEEKKDHKNGEVRYEKKEPEQKEVRDWGFKRKGITIVNGQI